jgi:hypothetical protein
MMLISNSILNSHREEECIAVTPEHKCYHVSSTFIKRSLRLSERQLDPLESTIGDPNLERERISHEAAFLQYLAEHTNIPAPKVYCCFEDDGAV